MFSRQDSTPSRASAPAVCGSSAAAPDLSMLNHAGRDRNPRNAEIGHRAKAQNRIRQKT